MAAKRSAEGLGTNSMTQTKVFSRSAVFSRLMGPGTWFGQGGIVRQKAGGVMSGCAGWCSE
ncbi:hypothetical protein D3C72_2308180 [compost metagenome]